MSPPQYMFNLAAYLLTSAELLSRINSFLPDLVAANALLEDDRRAGRLAERELENVEEGEGYIEMVRVRGFTMGELSLIAMEDQNLGLGVLEEKRPDDGDSSSDATSDGEDDVDALRATDDRSKPAEGSLNPTEIDVLGHLMGQGKNKRRVEPAPVIEEVEP